MFTQKITSKAELKKIIIEYGKALEFEGVKFKMLYLFGSYAKGEATKYSDLDVAIVSEKTAKGEEYMKEKGRMCGAAAEVDGRIEPHWIEEADLRKKSTIMAREVAKTGILILKKKELISA